MSVSQAQAHLGVDPDNDDFALTAGNQQFPVILQLSN